MFRFSQLFLPAPHHKFVGAGIMPFVIFLFSSKILFFSPWQYHESAAIQKKMPDKRPSYLKSSLNKSSHINSANLKHVTQKAGPRTLLASSGEDKYIVFKLLWAFLHAWHVKKIRGRTEEVPRPLTVPFLPELRSRASAHISQMSNSCRKTSHFPSNGK